MKAKILFVAVAIVVASGLQSCAARTNASSPKNSAAVTVPFTLHDNRILVDVKINGKGPFTFLFDTGGSRSNTLTPEVAAQLGLALKDGETARGAGSGTQSTWKTHIETYSVGDLIAHDQSMIVIDMKAIKKAFAFPKLDGVIGFDVLKRSVTCIDFENQTLTFKNDNAACFAQGDRATIPIRIVNDSPIIAGAVNGVATDFFVHTGDRSAFSLFQKFGKSSGLEKLFSGKPEVVSGRGIGGAA